MSSLILRIFPILSAPTRVLGVRTDAHRVSTNTVFVIWDAPEDANGEIIDYEVNVQKYNGESIGVDMTGSEFSQQARKNTTTDMYMKIDGLQAGTAYIVKVSYSRQ